MALVNALSACGLIPLPLNNKRFWRCQHDLLRIRGGVEVKRGPNQKVRELDVLRWVMAYIEEHNTAPTLRVVASRFGLSLRGVQIVLLRLSQGGYIAQPKGENRSIKVLKDAYGTPVRLEFVGDYA
jgi:hypothetical protein